MSIEIFITKKKVPRTCEIAVIKSKDKLSGQIEVIFFFFFWKQLTLEFIDMNIYVH